jgi:magnesium-transporting ATPase (P-type)
MMLMPLCFVITVNGIKDFCEDFKRKQSDNRENYSNCISLVLENEKKSNNKTNNKFIFKESYWKDLTPGQIVKINKNENFPADLLLIYSSNKNGAAFTETKNLDGETNLKYKEAIKNISLYLKKFNTEEKVIKEIKNLEGCINCDNPNAYLYDFTGVLKMKKLELDESIENKKSFYKRRESLLNDNDYNIDISSIFASILNSGN